MRASIPCALVFALCTLGTRASAQDTGPAPQLDDAVPEPPSQNDSAAPPSDDEFDPRFDRRPPPEPPPAPGALEPGSAATRLTPPAPYGVVVPEPPAMSSPPPSTAAVFVPVVTPANPTARRDARRLRRRTRWAPDLRPGLRLELRVMPFVGDAGGALAAFELRHQTASGFWSQVRVGPVGVAHAAGDNVGVFAASASAGMAWRLFGVGVGGGLGYLRIEDTTRRTRGLAPTYELRLRFGALYGVHVAITTLGAFVGGDTTSVGGRMRLRVPIRHRDLLDFDIDVAEGLAYVYTGVSWERGLGAREVSPWRIRPHVGLVEVIDPVGRDGGAGFSVGAALVYRTDGPAPAHPAPTQPPAAPTP